MSVSGGGWFIVSPTVDSKTRLHVHSISLSAGKYIDSSRCIRAENLAFSASSNSLCAPACVDRTWVSKGVDGGAGDGGEDNALTEDSLKFSEPSLDSLGMWREEARRAGVGVENAARQQPLHAAGVAVSWELGSAGIFSARVSHGEGMRTGARLQMPAFHVGGPPPFVPTCLPSSAVSVGETDDCCVWQRWLWLIIPMFEINLRLLRWASDVETRAAASPPTPKTTTPTGTINMLCPPLLHPNNATFPGGNTPQQQSRLLEREEQPQSPSQPGMAQQTASRVDPKEKTAVEAGAGAERQRREEKIRRRKREETSPRSSTAERPRLSRGRGLGRRR